MKKKEVLLRLGAMAMIAALGIAPVTSGISAMAATSTASTNNTATKNDLTNADIVDESRTGSITIKKYDITAAEAAGDYKAGTYKATGEQDSKVENALSNYAIKGLSD